MIEIEEIEINRLFLLFFFFFLLFFRSVCNTLRDEGRNAEESLSFSFPPSPFPWTASGGSRG